MSRLPFRLRQELKDTLMGMPSLDSHEAISRLLQRSSLQQYNIHFSPCGSSGDCLNQLLEKLYKAGGTEALSNLLAILEEQTPFSEQQQRIRGLQRQLLARQSASNNWVGLGLFVGMVVLGLVYLFVVYPSSSNNDPTPTPANTFTYQIKLLDTLTEIPVSRATVEIYLGNDLAPVTFITSDQGLALLPIPTEYDGKTVERIIFADGYARERKFVTVYSNNATQTVVLEPVP